MIRNRPVPYILPVGLLSLAVILSACTPFTGFPPPKPNQEADVKVAVNRLDIRKDRKEKRSNIKKKRKEVKESPKTPPLLTGDPCSIRDRGYGIYYPWVKNLEMGQMLMPKRGAITTKGGFDLIIHFHGGNAIRKHIARSMQGAFVVGIDLGAVSSAYGKPFKEPEVFVELLEEIEHAVAQYTGKKHAHIRNLGLTGYSAGYGAIRAVLRQKMGSKVDAVVLLDGLHSDYAENGPPKLNSYQMSPFVRFARQAAKQKRFMFVSHSSIVPPGYSSTTETTSYLTNSIKAEIKHQLTQENRYLTRYQLADKGNFLMRGYLGDQKGDHCAHLALITEMAQKLEQRWQTPVAKGKRYSPPKPLPPGNKSNKKKDVPVRPGAKAARV